jgi:hypothetical protein
MPCFPTVRAVIDRCGTDGWAMTPSGIRGVLNDAISLHFADATLASAFVAVVRREPGRGAQAAYSRCVRTKPAPRFGAGLHKTP